MNTLSDPSRLTPQERPDLSKGIYQTLLIDYEVSSASERQKRDRLIQEWANDVTRARDRIHDYLNEPGSGSPQYLHGAIDILEPMIEAMNQFLNRAGGRRK